MARLTELPPEVIIEIIKQIPQGPAAFEHPATTPDWIEAPKSARDQNDEDQIQLHQVMRVNQLFRDCVLRYLNTASRWPYYLPAAKNTVTNTSLETWAARAVEHEGDCYERLKIRAATCEYEQLSKEVMKHMSHFNGVHLPLLRYLISSPDLCNKKTYGWILFMTS